MLCTLSKHCTRYTSHDNCNLTTTIETTHVQAITLVVPVKPPPIETLCTGPSAHSTTLQLIHTARVRVVPTLQCSAALAAAVLPGFLSAVAITTMNGYVGGASSPTVQSYAP
jgi:hypothetical protein